MAYTTPATWSVGESPTAAKMNTQIRDNITALHDLTTNASAWNLASQNLANDTWTNIAFDQEHSDNAAIHTGSGTSFIIPVAGQYQMFGQVVFPAQTTSVALGARVVLNGATPANTILNPGCGQSGNGANVAAQFGVSVGDYIWLQGYQNSGTVVGALGGVTGVSFFLTRVCS